MVALGANKGEPRSQILTAVSALQSLAEGPVRLSSLWLSEGFGMCDQSSDFVNAVAGFATRLSAFELLKAMQQVEVDLGRPRDHAKNVARAIDLDLLLFGEAQIQTADLTVPHPRMLERLFVLLPMQELLPEYQDPIRGISIEEWIRRAAPIEITRLPPQVPPVAPREP